MKIATLQLDSKIRNVTTNIATADSILASSPPPPELDLLVLPELAFTGYNYPSYDSIQPYLEPTTAGATTKWAIATATRLRCHVIVGYPEISTDIDEDRQPTTDGEPVHKRYNSTVTVSPTGEILANYRKSFLYYTDESWAAEGPAGFYCDSLGSLGKVGLGICMDINPYQFSAPWDKYEFATHVLSGGAKLIVMSMAWLTTLPKEEIKVLPGQPALETVGYWLQRFEPAIEASKSGEDITVVFSNRIGIERNEVKELTTKTGQVIPLGDEVCYAGSSCAMRFSNGEVSILDMLGKGEEGLLLVDTDIVSLVEDRSALPTELTTSSLQSTLCDSENAKQPTKKKIQINETVHDYRHSSLKPHPLRSSIEEVRRRSELFQRSIHYSMAYVAFSFLEVLMAQSTTEK